jgi:4-aminobutyrate aminotransferase
MITQTLDDKMKKAVPSVTGRFAPVTCTHAKGSWFFTDEGDKWLDMAVGIAVVNTGHSHPKVIEAAKAQCDKIVHAQANMFYNDTVVTAANRILEVVPGGMDNVMFVNSGAEACENAVKLAKQATRRPVTIAFKGAFHGRTHMAMALTCSKAQYRGYYEPLPGGVYHARYPYPYRTPASEDPVDFAISDLRKVVTTECWPDDVASIIIEPIQGEGGFIVPPVEYFAEVRKIADEIGALLIIDEIQAGFGRTGKWFCHEWYGVDADIVTVAKGIASGFPLSAIVTKSEYFDKCKPGTMGGTYGGNAVACAASIATIDAINEEGMIANAAKQGEKLRGFFTKMQETYPCIGEVRGMGLMNAIEIVKPGTKEPDAAATKAFFAAVNKRKVLILTCGMFDNVARMLPALNISDDEMDFAFEVFTDAAKEAWGA